MAVPNEGIMFGQIHDGQEFNLPLGQLVVKQLNNVLVEPLDEQQFAAAFSILSTLAPHDNIAPYTGYCCYDEPNDQQVRLVFCKRQGIHLDELHNFGWAGHFMIIQGITSGLRFLHETRPNDPIYHLDLKPCNIFFGIDMVPKIAFFGQSRLFAADQNHLNENENVPQPFGYIAPEYHNHGVITDRSDVFGLGILMLEILTGNQLQWNGDALIIQDYATRTRVNWSNVLPIQLRYPLINEAEILEVMGCIAIGIECLEIDHNIRPSAGEINDMLHARRPWLDDNLMKYCITQSSNPPGNIGYILSARTLWLEHPNEWAWHATPGGGGIARFPERAEHQGATLPLRISGEMATKHLMMGTRYSVLLVYALAPNHSGLIDGEHRSEIQSVPFPHVNFQASQERGVRLFGAPPLDGAPEPDVMSYPVDRGDGTMEVELGWFHIICPVENGHQRPNTVIAKLSIMSAGGKPVRGLIVEGMEFRPLNFVGPN